MRNQDYQSDTRILMGQEIGSASKRMPWMLKNISYLNAFSKYSKVKLIMGRANLEISKIDYNDSLYTQRLREFNAIMLICSQARFYSSIAVKTHSKQDWKICLHHFDNCIKYAQGLLKMLENGSKESLAVPCPQLSNKGTEIEYADDAPVVPEICPVVILEGSSFNMGYQYARQLYDIYGPWILEKKAQRKFPDEALEVIKKWENQLKQHAPEILDMCRGWAKGASDIGIKTSYMDVLEIWTGHMPPKRTYMGRGDKISDVPPPVACSGAAAWGKATKDGKLVTGSTGDHDPSFPIVIMAYPDTGNSFMFNSFSAVGDITLVGSQHMFGFPGINDKGLAYVEHGGQPRLIEPKKYWGYGIRRAASVFHILRYANSAKEALDMELSMPIGDVGMDNGTIGGFYADSDYGYVLESRKEPVIIRESGYMGETDFMYANNSAMHKDASKAGWRQEDAKENDDWVWDKHGGWYPKNAHGFKMSELFKGGDGQAIGALRGMYKGCLKRNLYHYNILNKAVGSIDMEYMKMMFRNSGTVPAKPWKEANKSYNKTGIWGDISVGNASNGVITVTKPDEGLFSVCVGQAKRGVTPTSPFLASFCPMYNETNAFWEVKLADKPEDTVVYTYERAKAYIENAKSMLETNNRITNKDTIAHLNNIFDDATKNLQDGETQLSTVKDKAPEERIYIYASATRAFTRAQVKALIVQNMISPPPNKPEHFDV